MENIIKKADVLIEALPYIKAFHNKVTVIKYGGSILNDSRIRASVLKDIVFLSFIGLRPILVHGGGPNISERLKAVGKKTDFFEGMRVTDKDTLKIVEEELLKLNDLIVNQLISYGAKAKGLSGGAKKIIDVKKKKTAVDLGYVGQVINIKPKSIMQFCRKRTIPVIAPMGMDARKSIYNVNADEAAAFISGSLQAEKLVLLTNVPGIMRDEADSSSLISTLKVADVQKLIKRKMIKEGMIPKVNACVYALGQAVKKTHIIDARLNHAILLEIFTDKGIGTEIVK